MGGWGRVRLKNKWVIVSFLVHMFIAGKNMRKVVTKLLILTLLELLKLLTLTWLMSNKVRTLCLWLKLVLLGIILLIMIKFQLTLLRLVLPLS